jgi:hypothetical protein
MLRHFFLLALLLGVIVPTYASPLDSTESIDPTPVVETAVPAPDTALSAVPDTALSSGPDSAQSAALAQAKADSLLSRAAEDSVFRARAAARRDSIQAAKEAAGSAVEWHAVSDSGEATVVTSLPALAPAVEAAVVSRPVKRTSPALPEVPREEESKVLMWTGIGLAVVGLVAFFAISGAGEEQPDELDLNPATDPVAGNNDAKTQKTMTIRWSH